MPYTFYILTLLYALFIAPFVRAFVLKTLWAWFMVPVFGLQPLGLAAAYGIGLALHTFVGVRSTTSPSPGESPKALVELVATPIVILLLGAIAHSFM